MPTLVRRIEKRSTVTGQVPTVPPSSDHTDGTWNATDIYEGELFFNSADNILYTRFGSTVVRIGPDGGGRYRQSHNLNSGDTIITHNLGLLPAHVTCWRNGSPIGVNVKTRTTTQITIVAASAISGVEVNISAW